MVLIKNCSKAIPRTGLVDPYTPIFEVVRGDYSKPFATAQMLIKNGRSCDSVFDHIKPLAISEIKAALAKTVKLKFGICSNYTT